MAVPLPVPRDPTHLGETSGSEYRAAETANPQHSSEPAESIADDSGIRSGMIISLLEKKPGTIKDTESDLVGLQEENRRLRTLLDQARERLSLMEREAARWRQREQEYEALLEEKSELIRQLHQELQIAKERPVSDRRVPREEELIALEQELLREREQLKRDEEQLMAEIRQMEVTLARERADLARQRNELQRLHQQIQTELEMAAREAVLRERLAPLYELHAELQRHYFGESRSSRRPPSSYQLAAGPTYDKSSTQGSQPDPANSSSARSPVRSPPATSASNPVGSTDSTPPSNAQENANKPGLFRRLFGLG